MTETKKYILLDTDFCIKSVKIVSENSKLIDLIMGFSGCEFCCHEKTLHEISNHDDEAKNWLLDQISSGKIHLYTDKQILDELGKIYGDSKYTAYCTYLAEACNAYDSRYYRTNFGVLSNYGGVPDETTFLADLAACEAVIGQSKSLGEKKSAVLLQLLQFLYPGQVYVFCSDDSGARKGFTSFVDVKCLSVISAFAVLKDLGYSKNDLEQYFVSYENLCNITNQVSFKVWKSTSPERISVPRRQVFNEIFSDNFEVLQMGDLKYKR